MMATYSPRSISSDTSRKAWMISAPIWYCREISWRRIRLMRRNPKSEIRNPKELQSTKRDIHAAWRFEALAKSQPEARSEEHTSELQSRFDLVCRLLLE